MMTTDTSPAASEPAQIHLPPSETFDILPPLHQLLARVDKHDAQSISLPVDDHSFEESSTDIGCVYPSEDKPIESHGGKGDKALPLPAEYEKVTPLSPKDFPKAVLEIKTKIRAALREVERLPDVDRTVEEQEEEIAELEVRIKKQREMLHSLAQVAKAKEERVG